MNSIVPFEKPRFELAGIVRLYGDDYRRTHVLSPLQHAVPDALANCRTAVSGGHLERCDGCGHETPAYNSCRNRCRKLVSLTVAAGAIPNLWDAGSNVKERDFYNLCIYISYHALRHCH